jgi:hypothetical protein
MRMPPTFLPGGERNSSPRAESYRIDLTGASPILGRFPTPEIDEWSPENA